MKIDTALLNIVASLIILAAGIVIHFYFRPKVFEQERFVRNTFQLGVFRWWLFAFEWVLFQAHVSHHIVIVAFDFLSMVEIALCWCFFSGNTLKIRQLVVYLAVGFGFLVWWNFFFADSNNTCSVLGVGPLWVCASEFTSAVTTGLIALIFILRYKAYAIPMAIIQFGYAMLQVPGYKELFAPSTHPCGPCLMALAAGKLISGSLFYLMFFLPGNYAAFKFPTFDFIRQSYIGAKLQQLLTNRFIKKVFKIIGIVLIHVVAGLIVEFVRVSVYPWLHSHLPRFFPGLH